MRVDRRLKNSISFTVCHTLLARLSDTESRVIVMLYVFAPIALTNTLNALPRIGHRRSRQAASMEV